MAMASAWVSDVNAKLAGQIRINYVGGPEVITRFQQAEALRTGVIDVIFPPTGDYQDQMPASQAFVLSKLSPSIKWQEGPFQYVTANLCYAKGYLKEGADVSVPRPGPISSTLPPRSTPSRVQGRMYVPTTFFHRVEPHNRR